MLKSGQDWSGIFNTLDATGALATPSVGPTGTLYIDGVANAATVTITGSNPYKFSVTLPTLTAGQRVDMYITATISGIDTAGIVASDQADTVLGSDIKSDTADILADTGTDGVLISSGAGAKQIDLASGKVLLQPTQAGVTIPTVTNLTNLPTMPTDWVTANGVKADAVAKIQSGLATDAALSVTDGKVDAIKAKTDNLPDNPAPAGEYDTELANLRADVNAIAPLDEVLIDTGTQQFTTADLIKIVAAKMVGKASGGGTTSIVYRNIEDSVDIIIETVDENGNRSDITLAP